MTSRLVICCPVCPLNVINNCGGGDEFFKYDVILYSCSDYGMLHSKPALEDCGSSSF